MPPVLAAAARLVRAKAQALEHGALLLEGVIVAFATAETVAEVLVVFVTGARFLGMDAFGIRRRVKTEGAGAGLWVSGRSAIARKIPLVEYLDEAMLAVALHGARIADTGGIIVRIGRVLRRRVAGKAGEDTLA